MEVGVWLLLSKDLNNKEIKLKQIIDCLLRKFLRLMFNSNGKPEFEWYKIPLKEKLDQKYNFKY